MMWKKTLWFRCQNNCITLCRLNCVRCKTIKIITEILVVGWGARPFWPPLSPRVYVTKYYGRMAVVCTPDCIYPNTVPIAGELKSNRFERVPFRRRHCYDQLASTARWCETPLDGREWSITVMKVPIVVDRGIAGSRRYWRTRVPRNRTTSVGKGGENVRKRMCKLSATCFNNIIVAMTVDEFYYYVTSYYNPKKV